ncbi:MAG: phosphate ABC transporter permease PstA [Xanthomonadales bacterium]|nr:phosphate ABC transporter permease PstA [Xanthomonadales bacterium]MBP7419104.1 phosphate ABC transporter permease PstA [Xanthomonadales bacterium]
MAGAMPAVEMRALIVRQRRKDLLFVLLGVAALGLAFATFITLFLDMLFDGWSRLRPEFFTQFASRKAEQAGILAAWVGTLAVMVVTALVAVPLGVAAGIYLEEYAARNKLTAIIEININNLAGVPSIVYGLLALGMFVHTLGLGASIRTAGLTLALLILPIVIVATREAIRAIPGSIREAAYALGATRWQLVRHHVLPYSLPGILTGVIIGLSRAIGETAPIITIGAVSFIAFLPPAPVQPAFPWLSFEWLASPFTAMPIQIFGWTSRPEAAFQANASAAALVLVAMTLVMNAIAIWLRYRLRRNLSW